MAHDVEFELADSHSEQQLISELADHFPLAADGTARETLVFFDTFDWRLWKRGHTLQTTRRGRRLHLTLTSSGSPPAELRIPRIPGFATDLQAPAFLARFCVQRDQIAIVGPERQHTAAEARSSCERQLRARCPKAPPSLGIECRGLTVIRPGVNSRAIRRGRGLCPASRGAARAAAR